VDTPGVNASHQEAPSKKDLMLSVVAWAAAACQGPWQGPVTAATIVTRNITTGSVLERAEPEQLGEGNGGSWKGPGNRGVSVRQSGLHIASAWAVSPLCFFHEKAKPNGK